MEKQLKRVANFSMIKRSSQKRSFCRSHAAESSSIWQNSKALEFGRLVDCYFITRSQMCWAWMFNMWLHYDYSRLSEQSPTVLNRFKMKTKQKGKNEFIWQKANNHTFLPAMESCILSRGHFNRCQHGRSAWTCQNKLLQHGILCNQSLIHNKHKRICDNCVSLLQFSGH